MSLSMSQTDAKPVIFHAGRRGMLGSAIAPLAHLLKYGEQEQYFFPE